MIEEGTELGSTNHLALPNGSIEAFYDGAISLASGNVRSRAAKWETERLTQGLKLVVVDNSELLCKLPNCRLTKIVGPCICAIWNEGECEGMQSFPPGCCLQYTAISLSTSAINECLVTCFEQLPATLKIDSSSGPSLAVTGASQSVRALCAQVATCPLRGLSRTLYLSGKALEIAAHALDAFDATPPTTGDLRLSTADIEKLHQARDILTNRMRHPPSLAELSLSVGLNTRKLTAGFRRVFGDSVFGYLQTAKLDTAYRMLVEGEMSVSSAAYYVGYSPAHFSVAFRKRFGISPKDIRL